MRLVVGTILGDSALGEKNFEANEMRVARLVVKGVSGGVTCMIWDAEGEDDKVERSWCCCTYSDIVVDLVDECLGARVGRWVVML
jgi:hypothetical protein